MYSITLGTLYSSNCMNLCMYYTIRNTVFDKFEKMKILLTFFFFIKNVTLCKYIFLETDFFFIEKEYINC